MNLASVLVAVFIAALLVLAVRYVVRHGVCALCPDVKSCRAGDEKSAQTAGGCGGSCGRCPYSGQCHPK